MARPRHETARREEGRLIGALVAQARKQRGLSQTELAGSAQVSIDTLRKLEQGLVASPGFMTIVQLARGLGLSLDEISQVADGSVDRHGPILGLSTDNLLPEHSPLSAGHDGDGPSTL